MKENEYYSSIGNWDFADINVTVIRKTNFEFFSKIKEYSNEHSLCLDIGTGGGEKLLNSYPKVGYIIATDFSSNMIETANINLKKMRNVNSNKITFTIMDNMNMTFPCNLFDIVSSRHTVINSNQIFQILKPNGYLIIEGVDKNDCLELKNMFKRGQAYKDKKSIFDIDKENLIKSGFKIIESVQIYEDEYYKTKKDLLILLNKTPILDDISEIDDDNSNLYKKKDIEMDILNEYINKYQNDKGILLNRISYGIIAQKPKL